MSPLPDYAQSFAKDLAALASADNRAALAALRRGVGKEPGETFDLYRHLSRHLAPAPPWRESAILLVAPLFALHPESWDGGDSDNLGASFHRLKREVASDSFEKRFVALLNSHEDDLPHHLRQAISLLKAHHVKVDWGQLLVDVENWGHERRYVQRAWARAFWNDAPTAETQVNVGAHS